MPRECGFQLFLHIVMTLTGTRFRHVSIQFPGSRQYSQAGNIDNQEELGNVDPAELVKVIGTKEQCAEAIAVLSIPVSTPNSRSQTPQGRRGGADLPSRTVSIPNKYYHAVADGGSLARQLRQVGVQVDQPTPAPAKVTPKRPEPKGEQAGAKEARIDGDEEQAAGGEQIDYTFEVYPNYEGLGPEGEEEKEWVLRGKEEVLDKGVESEFGSFDFKAWMQLLTVFIRQSSLPPLKRQRTLRKWVS